MRTLCRSADGLSERFVWNTGFMQLGRFGGALIVSFAVIAGAGVPSTAQTTTEVRGSPEPASTADIFLDADVHIRSIRYQTVPKNKHVTVSGVNQVGGTRIVRTNLPVNPRAGVTYRNVRIQLQASSRFVDPAHPSGGPSATPVPRR